MTRTPSTIIQSSESSDATAAPPPPESQTSPGGQGGGSSPPVSPGPANAEVNSTQTSVPVANSFFKGSSPLLVVAGRSSFTTRTPQDTPIDPAVYTRWRTLLADGRLPEAADLCRERALTAPTEAARVCHVKDLAIVQRVAGDYDGALNIHVSLNLLAERFAGSFRARIENGFARSLETTGDFAFALRRYTEARIHAEQGGDFSTCANVDLNTARCLVTARNPADSYLYLDRAALLAQEQSDLHLLGLIYESRALALEAEEKFDEGVNWAWVSIQLLTQAGDRTAYEESARTYARLKGKA